MKHIAIICKTDVHAKNLKDHCNLAFHNYIWGKNERVLYSQSCSGDLKIEFLTFKSSIAGLLEKMRGVRYDLVINCCYEAGQKDMFLGIVSRLPDCKYCNRTTDDAAIDKVRNVVQGREKL